jgi:hypothetical protein
LGLYWSLFIYVVFVLSFLYPSNNWLSDLYHDTAKNMVFAHMPVGNTSRVQSWTDSSNDINIKFIYEPQRPIIDTFTELKFSIENATNGNHISGTENAIARVVITNSQRLFKFENISVGNDGHFSVKYLFPDDGTHQVITRLDTNNSSTASSFNVFVPHQAPPSILNPFYIPPGSEIGDNPGILLSVILAIILPVSGVVGIMMIFKLGKTKK